MIPNLPTDNLYKFLALSGLALVVFCFWSRWKVQDSIPQEEAAARAQIVALLGDVDAAMNKKAAEYPAAKGSRFRITFAGDSDLKESLVEVIQPGTGYAILRYGDARARYRDALAAVDSWLLIQLPHGGPSDPKHFYLSETELTDFRKRLRIHGTTVEELWHHADNANQLSNWSICGVLVGLALAITGFILWFIRSQLSQDMLVRSEVTRLQKAIENPPLNNDATSMPEPASQSVATNGHSRPTPKPRRLRSGKGK